MLEHPIYIRFVDGACIESDRYTGADCECFKSQPSITYVWFDALVIVSPDRPTVVQSSAASAPWENYLPRLIADFWMSKNTSKAYFKSWKVLLKSGATELHFFTTHYQTDAARSYQLQHPYAQVAAMTGEEKCYLASYQRSLVERDPFLANQPVSVALGSSIGEVAFTLL